MKKTLLDRADEMLFGHFNPVHEPVTTATLWSAFLGGVIVALVTFILQMCGAEKSTVETVIGLMALGVLGWIAWMTWDSIRAFGTWWQSAVYGLYLLVLSGIAFMVGIWALMAALVILLFVGVIKVFFAPEKKRRKGKVVFSDGTEKKAECTGTGLCGEKYWKDEDGNTHVEY